MRTVFLVPRRSDGGHRDALWKWCRDRWERYVPDIAIVEGHHNDGPFNRSAAINRAARAAGDWDYGIVIDSDVFVRVSQLRAAIDRARRTGKVTWAHRRWRGLSQEATSRVLNPKRPHDFGPEIDHDDMDLWVERTTPISWSCCIVVPRRVWDDIGGFDERFVGWGWDDMAFKSLVTGLYGWERIDQDIYHLHHQRSEERIVKGEPAYTASREYIANARLGRRYMAAVIRDHGIGDQPGEERLAPALRERHVANLMRDDAKLAHLATRLGLPDWEHWWPTLEELQAGARAYRIAFESPKVTAICHTGGDAAAWPERRDYLRASLASFSAMVSGPITQRVLYSDWGDEHLDELDAIAREFGFYVAGEGHHGYTGSMRRMWGYLKKRGQGNYVFQLEDDFVYLAPIDLTPMIEVLNAHRHLAQLALLREPAYPREFAAGGILGWPEAKFTPEGRNGTRWLEHRLFWTNNPALWHRSITDHPWPNAPSSERVFGDSLVRGNPTIRFAFWGDGTPQIRHIGAVRASTTY